MLYIRHKSQDKEFGKKFHSWKSNHKVKVSTKRCYRCGGEYPHAKVCPAQDKTCRKCNKVGHFERCCTTKTQQNRNHRTLNKVITAPVKNNKNVSQYDFESYSDVDNHDEFSLFAVQNLCADVKLSNFETSVKIENSVVKVLIVLIDQQLIF